MNVSLTPRLEAYVRRKVASGLYNNASELVREALRLLIEREETTASSQRPGAPDPNRIREALLAEERALRARGIGGLSLYGSIARGEARPGSDIDILIDIAPTARFSLLDLASVQSDLEACLGHPVDLTTRDGLDPAIAPSVLAEAEAVF